MLHAALHLHYPLTILDVSTQVNEVVAGLVYLHNEGVVHGSIHAVSCQGHISDSDLTALI
jgi:hypothetical protein